MLQQPYGTPAENLVAQLQSTVNAQQDETTSGAAFPQRDRLVRLIMDLLVNLPPSIVVSATGQEDLSDCGIVGDEDEEDNFFAAGGLLAAAVSEGPPPDAPPPAADDIIVAQFRAGNYAQEQAYPEDAVMAAFSLVWMLTATSRCSPSSRAMSSFAKHNPGIINPTLLEPEDSTEEIWEEWEVCLHTRAGYQHSTAGGEHQTAPFSEMKTKRHINEHEKPECETAQKCDAAFS